MTSKKKRILLFSVIAVVGLPTSFICNFNLNAYSKTKVFSANKTTNGTISNDFIKN